MGGFIIWRFQTWINRLFRRAGRRADAGSDRCDARTNVLSTWTMPPFAH